MLSDLYIAFCFVAECVGMYRISFILHYLSIWVSKCVHMSGESAPFMLCVFGYGCVRIGLNFCVNMGRPDCPSVSEVCTCVFGNVF